MKNAPNLDLALLARQWGATAVPFGELSTEAWLETPQNQRALRLAGTNAPPCAASCSWPAPTASANPPWSAAGSAAWTGACSARCS